MTRPRQHQGSSSRTCALERRFLDAVVRMARQRFDVECAPYVRAVERRLKVGAERYGDGAFLNRDNLLELLEETPDVAGEAEPIAA